MSIAASFFSLDVKYYQVPSREPNTYAVHPPMIKRLKQVFFTRGNSIMTLDVTEMRSITMIYTMSLPTASYTISYNKTTFEYTASRPLPNGHSLTLKPERISTVAITINLLLLE
jgi:hypothetical protein